jgi:hypothetical protein
MTDSKNYRRNSTRLHSYGSSVDLINAIIAGTAMADDTAEDKQGCVDRNVEHLELMVAKDYWTDEDMTAVNSAITAGNGYTA